MTVSSARAPALRTTRAILTLSNSTNPCFLTDVL